MVNSVVQVRAGRSLIVLTSVLGAGLLLSGCGADAQGTDAPSGDDVAVEALPAGEGQVEYPMELENDFGATTLEERPERIAVISPSTVDSDVLVALGVTPVMSPSTLELEPWISDEVLDNVQTLWESEAGALPAPEDVAAAEPDLIVALGAPDTFSRNDFDQFSSIAPVLLADAEAEGSWQEITEEIGTVLDLEDAAAELIEGVDAQIAAIAENNPQFEGKTAAHVHVYGQEYGASYFSSPGSDSAALLGELGFELPENAQKFPDEDTVSDELIGDIDADVLLVTVTPAEEGADWFLEKPLFQTVPAVKEGRYAVFEPEEGSTFAAVAWALRMQSPLSLPWVAEELETLAHEAMD